MKNLSRIAWITAVAALVLVPAGQAMDNQVTPIQGGDSLTWNLDAPNARGFVLTVSHPDGVVTRHEFGASDTVQFSLFRDDQGLADGLYVYEIRESIKPTPEMTARFADERRGEPTSIQAGSRTLPEGQVWNGVFRVESGSFVVPREEAEPGGPGMQNASAPDMTAATAADQVIPDDLIVQRSLCVGFDCVNNEDFGFDTIRMKENNTRIKFEDTSVGSFPTTDWQLTANDSASGGQNKFSIEDISGAKVPFTITSGAPTNSLFVASTGRLGLRTSTPVLDLHISTSNTPGMRLEQTNAGGFTAQTWDIAGNEANFFVRDVTGGSRLPFRIRPGAPTSSIDIANSGNVGIGTASPGAALHISRSDGSSQIKVEEASATEAARELAQFFNNGTVAYRFTDTQGTASLADDFNWIAGLKTNNQFIITPVGTIGAPLWRVDSAGEVTATSFNSTSSREFKEEFEPVDSLEVLHKVLRLPIAEWQYKNDENEARHLGPTAEEFADAFGLNGVDDKHIAVTDLGGVALAAVQGINRLIEEKDLQIQELRAFNAQLAARLEALEERMAPNESR